MTATPPIEFIDLGAQRRRIGQAMDDAILSVVHGGSYILGPQVGQLERELAAFCGARHAIGCANGTDAMILVLEALGIGPGDAVICPSFTFAATAEVVAWMGATPVFAEIDERTYTLDPAGLDAALATGRQNGLRPRALIAVDLFGQTCDYDPIEAFCARHDLDLIVDAAQGFGASYKGRPAGSIGQFATTSFFPAKPLGCYGDGGAIFTDSDEHAALIRSLQVHGKGSHKYDNVRVGVNSRLDTLQAAVLIEKLRIFPEEIERRQTVARRYDEALAGVTTIPVVRSDCVSSWALYTIRVDAGARATFVDALKARGIPTAIYYPKPLHRQVAYRPFPVAGNGLPLSEKIADEVVSLPMHPYLDEVAQNAIIDAVCSALRP